MNIDTISSVYLPTLTPPPQLEMAVDISAPSKDFSFMIGENREMGSDFTRMIKAAQAGDVVAKQEVERLGQGCCGSC